MPSQPHAGFSPSWNPHGVPRFVFLLGKPPRKSTVLPEIITALVDRGGDVEIHVPAAATDVPGDLPAADLVVIRGLGRAVLAALSAREAADGLRCCNGAGATLACADRALLVDALVAAGVPVPPTRVEADWDNVLRGAAGSPVVVKARDALRGRAAGVWLPSDGPLPDVQPFPGPYLLQRFVPSDGIDRKLYVLGGKVAGLHKSAGTAGARRRDGIPVDPSHDLAALARRAAGAIGLELAGIDILEGTQGPLVIDVNPFPSARGVAGAAETIAAHLGYRAWKDMEARRKSNSG
jgi:ribosomal protein S6--L-glutamate ligase